MGLFARLFKKSEPHQEITKTSSETLDDNESEMKWKAVPAYIEASNAAQSGGETCFHHRVKSSCWIK